MSTRHADNITNTHPQHPSDNDVHQPSVVVAIPTLVWMMVTMPTPSLLMDETMIMPITSLPDDHGSHTILVPMYQHYQVGLFDFSIFYLLSFILYFYLSFI